MLIKSPICRRLTGIILVALLYVIPGNAHASTIVTTIKPLYSLVAHLTDGIDKTVLLMQQNTSPHHYNMRPSERRLLAEAQVIIWIGPPMESYLTKVIEQQKQSKLIISALQASGLKLLNKQYAHTHETLPHSSEPSNAISANSGVNTKRANIDPHIWLSTHNAEVISRHIAQQLIIFNPDKTSQYNKNLDALLNKIKNTKKVIHAQLASSNTPFIAYHDAFQYFVAENKLNHVGSISFSDEAGVSLKHIRQIKARIDKDNIQCLVYQAPKPAIIKTLMDKTSINAVELDPLGVYSKSERNSWFEIMQQLTLNFTRCLASPNSHPK